MLSPKWEGVLISLWRRGRCFIRSRESIGTKHGPAGTRIQINKNVDSDFYHNLFAETGGIFDLIEEKLPWLKGKKGKEYYIQQDGARPHTTEGTVEDLTLAGRQLTITTYSEAGYVSMDI